MIGEYQVKKAEFLCSSESARKLKLYKEHEVAFLGRSNVGKSSLINRLTGQKALARVSKTPGRTQTINLFSIEVRTPRHHQQKLHLVDLPGYGFAKVPHAKRDAIIEMLNEYLETRQKLAALCLLVDARRGPEAEEQHILELLYERECPSIIVLTKCDKLGNAEKKSQIRKICAQLHLHEDDICLTGDGMSIAPLWERILAIGDTSAL